MKIKSLLFLAFVVSLFQLDAQGQVGFFCPKQNVEISKAPQGSIGSDLNSLALDIDQLVIRSKSDSNAVERYGSLPQGMSVDAYQERVGTYYTLIEIAQLSFPYAPEIIQIARVAQSQRLYRKGFQAIEGKGSAVKLNEMFCDRLIQAIRQHSF